MLTKAQIKYIQSLGHKKLRDDEGVFTAEGPKVVNELLNAPNISVRSLFGTASFAEKNPSVKGLTVITEAELERISLLSTPNEVLAVFTKPGFSETEFRGKITVMLDCIQDPGNLGSIIRSCDWFGVETIICSRDSADAFNSKVVQATMGSLARVNIMYTELQEITWSGKLPGLYAATLDGKDVRGMERLAEGVIVIGNESKGISEAILKNASHRITIPRKGHAESLNAGVAAGILLSHLT